MFYNWPLWAFWPTAVVFILGTYAMTKGKVLNDTLLMLAFVVIATKFVMVTYDVRPGFGLATILVLVALFFGADVVKHRRKHPEHRRSGGLP